MSAQDGSLEDDLSSARPLDVRLSLDPPDGCGCPSQSRETTSIRQSLSTDADGTTTCDMVLKDDGPVEYAQTEVCDCCPCYQLTQHDCVAEPLDVRDGRIHFSVTIPDRSKLPPLIQDLREAGTDVSVHRILSADEEEDDGPTLTEKQRETLELAIESGYYDRPRTATLGEIADELDITTSAASQRLSSVNRRLIRRYTEETCSERPD